MGIAGFDVFLIRMKFERLLVDHLLKDFLRRLEIIPGPIKWLLTLRLSFFVVQALEIWVLQALLDCVAFLRVENKHFPEEI